MNNLKLEDHRANALGDEDAHKVNKHPLSDGSKACVGHEH